MNFASRIYPNPMKNPEIGINLAIPMTQIQTNPEICINVAINLHQSSKVKKEPSKISHKSPQIFINPDTSHIIPWFFPISAQGSGPFPNGLRPAGTATGQSAGTSADVYHVDFMGLFL